MCKWHIDTLKGYWWFPELLVMVEELALGPGKQKLSPYLPAKLVAVKTALLPSLTPATALGLTLVMATTIRVPHLPPMLCL